MTRRVVCQAAVGTVRPLWARCIESVAAWCARHGYEHIVQREPILRIVPGPPRVGERAPKLGYLAELEKFAAWDVLRECDALAQIDADVYAQPGAPCIFEAAPPAVDFAAVVEPDIPVNEACRRKLAAYALGQYGRADARWHQCGVQVLRPSLLDRLYGASVRDMLTAPRWAPLINGEGAYRWSSEQTLLNLWLREAGAVIGDLPWQWNAPFGMMGESPASEAACMAQAHMVHFLCGDHVTGDDPAEMIRTGIGRTRI
jgi:hypothetical protein